jgi:hypothetical protein
MSAQRRELQDLHPTFACVAERGDRWFARVRNLVLSIRRLGGRAAGAPIVAHFVEGVDDTHRRALEDLGADVEVVARVDPEYPYANKLRMFQTGPRPGTDCLVALDCDVAVVDDVTPFLSAESICVKPADCDFLTEAQWQAVFTDLGVAEPPRATVTTTFHQVTYPYFNSGVVIVPATLGSSLADRWLDCIHRLGLLRARRPDIGPLALYTDQVALACALAAGPDPVRLLPVGMNFPTHVRVHPAYVAEAFPVRVIHYHDNVDARGFLVPTTYRQANAAVDRFNRERSAALGVAYQGLGRASATEHFKVRLRSRPWYYGRLGRRARVVGRRLVPSG